MISHIKNRLWAFRKEEVGAVFTLEFAVMLPLLFMALMFGVELTTHANRQFQVDRALEVTTRAIKLNTAANLSHNDLKTFICQNSGGLDNCDANMRLEMTPINPRDFAVLPSLPDCIDQSEPVNPIRGWTLGQQHELMILRACYNFEPVFGSLGLGKLLGTDGAGMGKMVAISAFVQEPRYFISLNSPALCATSSPAPRMARAASRRSS